MKNWLKNLFNTDTLHGKIMRGLVFLFALVAVVLLGVLVLKVTGWWEKVNSIEKIRSLVESGGVFSVLIFMLFQILQTTVLQIPAVFVTVAGAWVFGAWPAFFMSYAAILIGSIIMFWIGRKAGRKFLNWIVGKDTAEKWITRISGGKYLFFLMMLFPMFPDDILCVIAGLTNMSFSFFIWTNVIARALGLICTVFLGSGQVIPFKGWGLVVWGVLIVVVAVLFYVSVRFKDKLDEILDQMFKKSPSKTSPASNISPSENKHPNHANLSVEIPNDENSTDIYKNEISKGDIGKDDIDKNG